MVAVYHHSMQHEGCDARELTMKLKGRWHGSYGTAPCPVCQPERRRDQNALTLGDGRVGLLLDCKKSGCDFRHVLAAAGLQPGDYRAPDRAEFARRSMEAQANTVKRAGFARRLWNEAQPIADTPAEAYLRGRGIDCELPDTLRFHPRCFHGPSQRALSAMVALVEGGEDFAVHRTYLQPDGSGKAGLPSGDKMMLGTVRGGAVKLSEGPGRFVVAEGIESALSLMCGLLDGPAQVWASLSTSGMRSLRLPSEPSALAIATDADPEGRKAAQSLAQRAHLAGWRVSILDPGEGQDFNDILKDKAVLA